MAGKRSVPGAAEADGSWSCSKAAFNIACIKKTTRPLLISVLYHGSSQQMSRWIMVRTREKLPSAGLTRVVNHRIITSETLVYGLLIIHYADRTPDEGFVRRSEGTEQDDDRIADLKEALR